MLASRVAWKIPGVVRLEKVMVFAVAWSRLKPARNCFVMLVLAVPGPPTSSTGCKVISYS